MELLIQNCIEKKIKTLGLNYYKATFCSILQMGQNPNYPPPPPAHHHGIGKFENHPMLQAHPQITLKKPRVTFNSTQVVKLEQEFKKQR